MAKARLVWKGVRTPVSEARAKEWLAETRHWFSDNLDRYSLRKRPVIRMFERQIRADNTSTTVYVITVRERS